MTNPLLYRVECQPIGQRFFEVIAAFNVESAALAYATDCQCANRANDYRVKFREHILFDEIYVTGAAIIQNKLGRAHG